MLPDVGPGGTGIWQMMFAEPFPMMRNSMALLHLSAF
jgi:hypothetical protein